MKYPSLYLCLSLSSLYFRVNTEMKVKVKLKVTVKVKVKVFCKITIRSISRDKKQLTGAASGRLGHQMYLATNSM